jgi:outer membrane protein OmpA-like peptidoglycan-associated protein
MLIDQTVRISCILSLGLGAITALSAELVTPFAGSEEIGRYATDYDRYIYLVEQTDTVEPSTVEGRFSSRIFKKPTEKSTLEVYRSYERELQSSGFTILASLDIKTHPVRRLAASINQGAGSNLLADRPYKRAGKPAVSENNWLAAFTEYYISAKKIEGAVEYLVVVVIADRRDIYAVDVFESAVMETDTVALSLDGMRSQMATDGRVAVYGILFDTGSANLRAESNAALEVIVAYLNENPEQLFYVVGHTDDQGPFTNNLSLSAARAEAVRTAIIKLSENNTVAQRLLAHGVGPLSPVATNKQAEGRQLNRRVELVSATAQ